MPYRIEMWRYFMRRFNACYNHYRDCVPGACIGFDLLKFDQDIIKSGDICALDVCREKFGPVAAKLILALTKTPYWLDANSVMELSPDIPESAAEIAYLNTAGPTFIQPKAIDD